MASVPWVVTSREESGEGEVRWHLWVTPPQRGGDSGGKVTPPSPQILSGDIAPPQVKGIVCPPPAHTGGGPFLTHTPPAQSHSVNEPEPY